MKPMTDNVITCSLFPNSNKAHEMHPDLRGKLQLGLQTLDVALWTRTTKDRRRIYHSATITPGWKKGDPTTVPLVKGLKLYEFRKRQPGDPDFQAPETCNISGKDYTAALWVEVGTPEDIEDLKFTLALMDKPFSEGLSGDCAHTMASLRERLKTKAKEEEEEREYKERQAAGLEGEEDEPDSIPF